MAPMTPAAVAIPKARRSGRNVNKGRPEYFVCHPNTKPQKTMQPRKRTASMYHTGYRRVSQFWSLGRHATALTEAATIAFLSTSGSASARICRDFERWHQTHQEKSFARPWPVVEVRIASF